MIQTPGDPNYGHGPNASQLTSPSGGPPPFGPTGGSGGSIKGSSGASGSVVSLIEFNGFITITVLEKQGIRHREERNCCMYF